MNDQNLQSNLTPTESPQVAGGNAFQNLPPPVGSPRQRYLIATILILAAIALGYWVWQNQIVTPPSALPEGEGTSASPLGGGSEGVESWKTYRNEEYGFEFKYPAELIVTVTEDKNTMGTPQCLSLIELYDKKELESLLDGDVQSYLDLCVTKSLAEAQSEFSVQLQWEPSVLDNKPAMKGMVTTLPVLLVELVGDKGLYLYSSRSEILLDQILPTFRFID